MAHGAWNARRLPPARAGGRMFCGWLHLEHNWMVLCCCCVGWCGGERNMRYCKFAILVVAFKRRTRARIYIAHYVQFPPTRWRRRCLAVAATTTI